MPESSRHRRFAALLRWERLPKLQLLSLFWLQFFLSPLFLSPLSQRMDVVRTDQRLLLFVIAPLFYSVTLAWFTKPDAPLGFPWVSQQFRRRTPVARGGVFGAYFGAFGFLPYALIAALDVIRHHDPTLPVTRWMVVIEPIAMVVVVGFFAAFFSLFGMLGGCVLSLFGNDSA